jgi:hypothetical protein
MQTVSISAVSALVGILAVLVPGAVWIGRLRERVDHLESQVERCADKDIQQAHDSWIKSWSDELNYRLRRLEEHR